MKTAVAIYEDFEAAEASLRALRRAGVRRDRMNLIGAVDDDEVRPYFDSRGRLRLDPRGAGHVARDQRRGSMLGIGSVLASAGLLAIPAIGPVLAAGPLLAGVLGAGAGAASEGIHGLLHDIGIPVEEAEDYVEAMRRGYVVLLVTTPTPELDEVARVLSLYGAIDLSDLRGRWERDEARVEADARG